MSRFVTRNTYANVKAMHTHHVYGFDVVCKKYWGYREG